MKQKKYFSLLCVVALVAEWSFPSVSYANERESGILITDPAAIASTLSAREPTAQTPYPIAFLAEPGDEYGKPLARKHEQKKPVHRFISGGIVVATAYSSTVDQTDNSPCITANGFNVCEHNVEDVIAANFLPMGTRVRFPELYGDRIFTVRDRMNKRFSDRVDFWKKSRADAKRFGVKRVRIEIVSDRLASAER